MRLFGVEITFIDRSREQGVQLASEYERSVSELTSTTYAGSDEERRELYGTVETMRQEMINRGYLDDDDSSY